MISRLFWTWVSLLLLGWLGCLTTPPHRQHGKEGFRVEERSACLGRAHYKEGTFHALLATQYNQSLYSHKKKTTPMIISITSPTAWQASWLISALFCTISTSDSDEIERTYIVTPTSTAGPANDTLAAMMKSITIKSMKQRRKAVL